MTLLGSPRTPLSDRNGRTWDVLQREHVKGSFSDGPRADVRVFVRVRAFSKVEIERQQRQAVFLSPGRSSITVKSPLRLNQKFSDYNEVFDEQATTWTVYDRATRPLVDDLFRWRSSLLLALGASNSGKSLTMHGSDNDAGLFRRAIYDVFGRIDQSPSKAHRVSMALLEVHDERVYCLLPSTSSSATTPLRLDTTGSIRSPEISYIPIRSGRNAMMLLKTCLSRVRHDGPPRRSHIIVSIRLGDNTSQHESHLSLCLLGSLRDKRSESSSLNSTSLMHMERCVEAVRWNATHPDDLKVVPFRQSKLTRLFRYDLVGEEPSTIVKIVHIAPGSPDVSATLQLLLDTEPINLGHVASESRAPSSGEDSSEGRIAPQTPGTPGARRQRRLRALKFVKRVDNVSAIRCERLATEARVEAAFLRLAMPTRRTTRTRDYCGEFRTAGSGPERADVLRRAAKDLTDSNVGALLVAAAGALTESGRAASPKKPEPEPIELVPISKRPNTISAPLTKPEWLPDHAASACLCCHAPFWFLLRRHHCRACGLIYCHYCCSTWKALPWSQVPERVCRLCISMRPIF
ncbi:unnamed protein product (mitochondrion) [Plasmodiophora brassicae]|uniref:FYVE-type domain-containing protein n=1 Tax=Plasmodiophora brassicae TaxID=37360 RepID=A0A0G4II92_PLABS|nr:hypothetical protein PBRA_003741 [Plasmodiophora brassicae]SPQ94260.1 unnamed protein product [Plasmodiophora brassicae]